MKIFQRFALTLLTLVTFSLVVSGCSTTGSTMTDATFKEVSGETHRATYPDGHAPKEGRNCRYDQAGDVFFCSFAE